MPMAALSAEEVLSIKSKSEIENRIIINEVMIGSEINPEKDNWIEFYNPTKTDVKLEDWKIRGITKSGRWVAIVNKPDLTIKPDGYFLLSYYSNSRSSALDVKPDMQKSSLAFPKASIEIELKDPSGELGDKAIFTHNKSDEFKSYERESPTSDGSLSTSWSRATKQVNLKKDLKKTFATPGSPIGDPVGDPIGDPIGSPIGDPIGDKTETTDTTATPIETEVVDDVVSESELSEAESHDETAEATSKTDTTTQTNTTTTTETNDVTKNVGDGQVRPQNDDVKNKPTYEPAEKTDKTDVTTATEKKEYPTYKLINEIMPNPKGTDTEGEWVEIFNNTESPINLSGWYLDDADGASSPYQIKEKTILESNKYMVFSAPDLNLSLKNTDDQVRLLAPDKTVKEIVNYKGAKESYSYSKKENGEFGWTNIATQNKKNQFPPPPKSYKAKDIEFLNVIANPDGSDTGNEKITFRNNLNEIIKLDNWKIKNKGDRQFSIKGFEIKSDEKLTLNPAKVDLTLTNTSDELKLIDPAGNLIDQIDWANAESGKKIYKSDFFKDGIATKVKRVIDGDTIVASVNDEEFDIRLIGIDTPETVHPVRKTELLGIKASNYLDRLLKGKTVVLNFDNVKIDTYNRLLAYVYLEDQFVNAEIVRNGYGYAYTKFPFKYQLNFSNYETDAMEKRLGVWETTVTPTNTAIISNNIVGDADLHPQNDDINILPPNTPTENDEITPKIDTVSDELQEKPVNIENNEKNTVLHVGDGHVRPQSIQCPTTGLKIHSIRPNPDKNDEEYIKITNISGKTVCFNGWQLDDQTGKGSKIFKIKGGGVEQGAIRTFFKSETKLALNNINDCANLINPKGDIVDTVCYNKTHKGEVFTHDGGNWVKNVGDAHVRPKKKKISKKKTTRPPTNYKWDLKNETLNGKVAFVYDEGKVLYLQKDKKITPVSYANSKVDISMAKQILDFKSEVALDIHATGGSKELIGIKQVEDTQKEIEDEKVINKIKMPIKYIMMLTILLELGIIGYIYVTRFIFDKS